MVNLRTYIINLWRNFIRYNMVFNKKGKFIMNIKEWLDTHNLITYRKYLRDILGVALLLTIIYGFITIKIVQHKQMTIETQTITIMESRNKVVLNAIKDFYSGEISKDFTRAKYYIDTRNNVFRAISAAQRFMPVLLGPDYPFDIYDILAIIMVESRFNPHAVSHKKAKGIMQIIDPRLHIKEIDGDEDPFDIECNVYGGILCLKEKYDHTKDKRKAIIAYNGIVKRKNGTWKDSYYKKVMEQKTVIMRLLNAED